MDTTIAHRNDPARDRVTGGGIMDLLKWAAGNLDSTALHCGCCGDKRDRLFELLEYAGVENDPAYNELRNDVALRRLEEGKLSASAEEPVYYCDGCGRELTDGEHSRGQGLCAVCSDANN